jgi:hypothetical protein
LTALLKKDAFMWSAEAEAVFRALQCALTMTLILQHPNFDCDFVVECDASDTVLSVVVHQGGGPLAFFSHQLAPRHTKLAAYRLVQAVCHWRPYLWG